jgi:tetratricopeptide (TPR) repeat protein
MTTRQARKSVSSLEAIMAKNESCIGRLLDKTWVRSERRATLVALVVILVLSGGAQPAPTQSPNDGVIIRGRVLDSAGKPVPGASVRLEGSQYMKALNVVSDANGDFAFSKMRNGTFSLVAEKANHHSRVAVVVASEPNKSLQVDLVLENAGAATVNSNSSSSPSSAAMEFADSPSFTVAGVTDWTAAGGHGSDASLRASEALNREALTIKDRDVSHKEGNSAEFKEQEATLRAALTREPASFDANHRLGEFYLNDGNFNDSASFLQRAFQIDPGNAENELELAQACEEVGDLSQARVHVQHLLETGGSGAAHRLAGELDEKSGDPLGAVHEFERAVRMDSSEQNYFEWGSELLIHRAVWQARDVFEQGVHAYPKSVRLLTALGAALFGGALYDEAAHRLCEASDLEPDNPEPYLLIGKVEIAAPTPLTCAEPKLEKLVQRQPDNSRANYYLAMAIWKQSGQAVDELTANKIESMLTKAMTLDPKFSDPCVQLGILWSSRGEFAKAVEFYTRAIALDSQSSEAHYRLGIAYDRLGERSQAKQEFQLHEEIEKQRAVEVDRERRVVKQFVVELPAKATSSPEK